MVSVIGVGDRPNSSNPLGSVAFVDPFPTYRFRFTSPALKPTGSSLANRPVSGAKKRAL